MGRVHTTTEALQQMAFAVKKMDADLSVEAKSFLRQTQRIELQTSAAIGRSDQRIRELEEQISALESALGDCEASDDDSQAMDACADELEQLDRERRREVRRNEDLRRCFRTFRAEYEEALKAIRQLVTAAQTAASDGGRYLRKKVDILTTGYGKTVAGGAAGVTGKGGSDFGGTADPDEAPRVLSFGQDLSLGSVWGEEAFQGWRRSLFVSEWNAISDYKQEAPVHENSFYVNINNALRGKDKFHNGNQIRAARIHAALSKASVPADVTVYRAVTREAYEDMRRTQDAGGGLRDDAFISCSLVSDNLFTRNREVVMRLTVPEGTRGAYITNLGGGFEDECELLLDCGSSIYILSETQAPRSTITGNPADTDWITIVDGVIDQ